MATLSEVLNDLVTATSAQLSSSGLTYQVGSDFPADDYLQDVKRGRQLIAFVHRSTANHDNFLNENRSLETDRAVGISAAISGTTITITGTPLTGDTIGAIFKAGTITAGGVYVSVNGDTLAAIATGLTAQINDSVPNVTAVAVNNTVEITLGVTPYSISLQTGNATEVAKIVGTAYSSLQVNVWADSQDSRDLIRDILSPYFASFKGKWTFALTTSELVAIKFKGAKELDTERQKDIFDWCFLVEVEYFLTITEVMYRVFLGRVTQTTPTF